MKTLLGSASLLLVLVTSCANNTPATCDSPSCRTDCVSLGWVSGRCEEGDCRCTNTGFSCGDGVVDPGEACDLGGRNSDTQPNACRTDCTAPRCGDHVVDTGEACDDGNVVDGDSCRPDCTLPGCGDGVVQTGEECDDGNADDTDACLSTCRNASCGDGVTWAGHEDCEGTAEQSCTTPCGTTGSQSCVDCSWSATCTPPPDGCNGVDDDCDGETDEDSVCTPGETVACTASCGTAGSGACTATCEIPTGDACTPPAESCNGADDDCDTATDETFACTPEATGACTTSCGTAGSRTCSASCAWSACNPPAEVCNGADDDCDLACDNTFACCAGATGACTTGCGTSGSRTCTAGCTWGSCTPPAESCNGADDDCDTVCDDGFACCAGQVLSCATLCDSTGTSTCTGTCIAGACVPPAETCNAADDDCDTVIDNGFACIRGATVSCTTTCGSTGSGTCTGTCTIPTGAACTPPPESATDDDCDRVRAGRHDRAFEQTCPARIPAGQQPPGHEARPGDAPLGGPESRAYAGRRQDGLGVQHAPAKPWRKIMTTHVVPDQMWQMMKEHLGYSDEEIELFKRSPRNAKVLATAPDMLRKTIVFEVVESQGCNSQHAVGTRFYFTGDGNLITKMAPPRVCAYALPVMTQAIFGIQELWYAGADPNSINFRRGGCFDVGVQCGGWGHVVLEAKVMDREQATKLWQGGK